MCYEGYADAAYAVVMTTWRLSLTSLPLSSGIYCIMIFFRSCHFPPVHQMPSECLCQPPAQPVPCFLTEPHLCFITSSGLGLYRRLFCSPVLQCFCSLLLSTTVSITVSNQPSGFYTVRQCLSFHTFFLA